MSNLEIENLSKIVQTGDTEALFGKGGGIANDAKVMREMQSNGMSVSGTGESGNTFSAILRDSVDKVNVDQVQADHAIKELVAGRSKNIHETMLTVEKADASMKLMMQVRNKILDAYREIMRMQV
jgi:flagellar hook-basal body complex protein FliE